MKVYGIIGYPLGHSFSRNYFTEKFKKEGIPDCTYENFPLASIEELPALLRSQPHLCGFNVTIPYKEQVLPYLDALSDDVKMIGACNCVKIDHGKKTGYNTDVVGFEQSLLRSFPSLPSKALILGTGGAAKAVEFVFKKRSIPYIHVSRSAGPGRLAYPMLTEALLRTHPLIVNTTPLGMHPKEDQCPPIPYECLTEEHCLFDLIYNPAKTLFLRKGEERGARIQNGLEMLLIQAEENWKIWNE